MQSSSNTSKLILIGVFLVGLVVAVILATTGGDDAPEAFDPTSISKPEVEVPDGPPPDELQINDITEGEGTEAQVGDTLTMQYVGVNYSNGKEFDTSWDKPEPFSFQLGAGSRDSRLGPGDRRNEGRRPSRADHPAGSRIRGTGFAAGHPTGRDADFHRRSARRSAAVRDRSRSLDRTGARPRADSYSASAGLGTRRTLQADLD